MRIRKETAEGDMCFGNSGGDFWRGQREGVGQLVKNRLNLWLDSAASLPADKGGEAYVINSILLGTSENAIPQQKIALTYKQKPTIDISLVSITTTQLLHENVINTDNYDGNLLNTSCLDLFNMLCFMTNI